MVTILKHPTSGIIAGWIVGSREMAKKTGEASTSRECRGEIAILAPSLKLSKMNYRV